MFYLRVLLPAAFTLAGVVLLWCPITATASPEVTSRARKFIDEHTARLRPLEVAGALAWWNANISGKPEDFQKKIETQNRIDEALANAAAFAEVKNLKQHAKDIDDPIL